jgi:hypothetical protein
MLYNYTKRYFLLQHPLVSKRLSHPPLFIPINRDSCPPEAGLLSSFAEDIPSGELLAIYAEIMPKLLFSWKFPLGEGGLRGIDISPY